MPAETRKPPCGIWGPPLVDLTGTIAGMLIAFTRIGTEPLWKTVLVGRGFSSVVGVVGGLIVFRLLARSRR